MTEKDFHQWTADNDRLVIAGLSNVEPGTLNYDEDTIDAVKQRCTERFGDILGERYFQGLIATLPKRRPDLFPELADFE